MVMNKKGYMRILEAIAALLITFLAITFALPKSPTQTKPTPVLFLDVLEQDPNFRACVVSGDFNCVEDYVSEYIGSKYDFVVDISENPYTERTNLPEKNVYADSIYIAGNATSYAPRMIKVYYWEKR